MSQASGSRPMRATRDMRTKLNAREPTLRWWCDKKLRQWRTEATQQPAREDKRHEREDRDSAELEATMA